MKYNYIQRILSAALLLAFTVPSTLAVSTSNYAPNSGSTVLSGDVRLTNRNDKITLSLRDSQNLFYIRISKAQCNFVISICESNITG